MALSGARRLLWTAIIVALLGFALPASVAHADDAARKRDLFAAAADGRPSGADGADGAGLQHVATDEECRTDPRDDTADSRADILEWCVYLGEDEIRVSMTLWLSTTPEHDRNWEGVTGATWMFDVDDDGSPDYAAVLALIDGRTVFDISDMDGNPVCQPSRKVADSVIYSASFAPGCLDDADVVEVLALMLYDASPVTSNAEDMFMDAAPDNGPVAMGRHTHAAAAPTPAPSPTSAVSRTSGRLSGTDRVTTAVAISQRAFPDGADVVYLARQDLNPDALVAGSLSDGPVLLVPACGALPGAVADEIRRLGARQVFALGGPGSVCQQILDAAASA